MRDVLTVLLFALAALAFAAAWLLGWPWLYIVGGALALAGMVAGAKDGN